jgi:pimeloyl-ACP methyl ester carboxylesterase
MPQTGTPVIFVHGLWLHADSWQPWVDFFRTAGYDAQAPGWPGDSPTVAECRANPGPIANHGVDEVVQRYATIASKLTTKPIAIGHSFGGLIVQRLLAEGHVAAAVAIDPAPLKGVVALPASALKVASIALRNPANRKRAVSLTREQFRYGFGNALPAEESDRLYDQWTIPSPGRPLFEAAVSAFSPKSPVKVPMDRADRGPLLLTAGGKDHTVPPSIVRTTLKLHRKSTGVTEMEVFPDRGHSLTIDSGWREVADTALVWLQKQGF